jgi:hypothetical protein
MAADPLATGGILIGHEARLERGTSPVATSHRLIAGLEIGGPRGFAKAEANAKAKAKSGGATTNRNDNIP